MRALACVFFLAMGFELLGCRTLRDDAANAHSASAEPAASEPSLEKTRIGLVELASAVYLPYRGVEPFSARRDSLAGFDPAGASAEVKECALDAIKSFRAMLLDPTEAVSALQDSSAVSKRFELRVSDYTQASHLVRRRQPKVQFIAEGESGAGHWVWGVTAYRDKQGIFHCEHPASLQIMGALSDKLKLDSYVPRRFADRRRFR